MNENKVSFCIFKQTFTDNMVFDPEHYFEHFGKFGENKTLAAIVQRAIFGFEKEYPQPKLMVKVWIAKLRTSFFYFQCFENNRGAEKVEVNYERLKNPKKMFRPQSRTGLIRVRLELLTH
jgi:hypothetical protein